MRKPVLTILYQFNPENTAIGGIQMLIITFIKYALKGLGTRLVGTDDDATSGISTGLRIRLFLLFKLENDRIRDLISHTTTYISALFWCNLASYFMHFYEVRSSLVLVWRGLCERLEPTAFMRGWREKKTLFIHNNIRLKTTAQGLKKAIFWWYFPWIYLEITLGSHSHRILAGNAEVTRFSNQQHYPQLRDACGDKLRIDPVKPFKDFLGKEIYKEIYEDTLQRWDERIFTFMSAGKSKETLSFHSMVSLTEKIVI